MNAEKIETGKVLPASTVILVRDHDELLQVYLLKRNDRSGFFPGNYVFPGGIVDPEDADVLFWKHRSDLKSMDFAKRFCNGIDNDEILPFLVSAVRETFEEAGVFLIKENDTDYPILNKARKQRNSQELSQGWMQEFFKREPLTLNLSNLWPWSHWITPKLMKRRFNTRFLIAFMPSEQVCIPDNREVTDGIWISPREALLENLEGAVPMSPPTIVTVQELLNYSSVKYLKSELEDHSWGGERRPRFIPSRKGAVILEPWDPLCDSDADIDPAVLEEHVLPPSEPFSRLLLHKGIWKPVAVVEKNR